MDGNTRSQRKSVIRYYAFRSIGFYSNKTFLYVFSITSLCSGFRQSLPEWRWYILRNNYRAVLCLKSINRTFNRILRIGWRWITVRDMIYLVRGVFCLNMEFLCVDSSRLPASLQTLEIQSNTVTGFSGAWQYGNEKRDGELTRNLWNAWVLYCRQIKPTPSFWLLTETIPNFVSFDV